MPTVLRFDGLRVAVYPNDHRPAHVHVVGGGCEAVFNLNCPAGPVELALVIGDGGSQVLHLDQSLADQHDLGDFGNASHPRIANQLRIQRQQTLRLFRVSARRGLPLQQAALSIEFADGVDVGHEVVLSGELPVKLDLQIPSRLKDLDTIVLTESGQ